MPKAYGFLHVFDPEHEIPVAAEYANLSIFKVDISNLVLISLSVLQYCVRPWAIRRSERDLDQASPYQEEKRAAGYHQAFLLKI